MADCELLGTCIFFNDKMATMPGITNLMKSRYCRGDNSQCARYMIFQRLGRDSVPGDLAPNDVERAKKIIYPS